ncbi:Fur family transcriptional regulator [soil metagenome]
MAEAPTSPELEELLGRLRQRGARVTGARRAVLGELVATDGEHLSAETLAERVQVAHPEVHLSTVYRALEAFEEAGVIAHVHLGHAPSTYHLAGQAHHHAVCRACGAVVEVPPDVLDGAKERLQAELGFVLDPHHFALEGRCAKCADRQAGPGIVVAPRR